MSPNPHCFVVGCPRSGTTLLQRMLDAHPRLALANDAHFIQHGVGRRDGDVPMAPELVDRVVSYATFDRLGVSEDEARLAAARSATYAEFVAGLFDGLARKRGKPFAGEKAPVYVRYLPLLHALFPTARIVHIVRDGRDVALSLLDWARPGLGPGRVSLWETEPIAVSALFWRWHATTGMRDGAACGSSLYREVLYERLVGEPEPELRLISDFLDLPYAVEMLAYYAGKTRREPGLSSKSAWLPPTAGLRDWRRQMHEGDIELFEALAGNVLSFFGYERAYAYISPEIKQRAERCRERWEQEVRARNRRLASRLDLRIDPASLAPTAIAS
jgi:Sulfotransferase family